jgi:hypothetical protein
MGCDVRLIVIRVRRTLGVVCKISYGWEARGGSRFEDKIRRTRVKRTKEVLRISWQLAAEEQEHEPTCSDAIR